MKKVLIFLSLLLISIIIIPPFFIDKEQIKKFIQTKFEEDLNNSLAFDESIEVSLFPKPSLEIENVEISNIDSLSKYFLSSKRIKINTDWKSLLFKKKPSLDNIEIYKPKIIITQKNFENSSKIDLFHKVNLENKNQISKYFKYFKKLSVVDGELIIFKSKKNHFLFDSINLEILNINETSLKGELVSKDFNSNFKFTLDTKDFKKIKFIVDHNFLLFRDINRFDGTLFFDNIDLDINGRVLVNTLNLKEINKYFFETNKITLDTNNENLTYVNQKKKLNLKIKIDFLLKEIEYNQHLFKNTSFIYFSNGLQSIIRQGRSNYLGSEIDFFLEYFFKNEKINGQISGSGLIIPNWFFGKTKLDLFGGNTDFEIFLSNRKEIKSISDLRKNIIINANLKCYSPSISGIDIKEIINKFNDIKSFSNLIDILNYKIDSGITEVKSIVSKLKLSSEYIYIDSFLLENNDIDISTKGRIDIYNSKLNLKNNVEFNNLDLPGFQIVMIGDINKPELKYNLDKLRKKIINKTLNNLMKNNDNKLIIEPNKFFELLNNENLNSNKIFEKLF